MDRRTGHSRHGCFGRHGLEGLAEVWCHSCPAETRIMCSSFLLNLRYPPGKGTATPAPHVRAEPALAGDVCWRGGAVPRRCGEEALRKKKVDFGRETPAFALGNGA